jgi:cell division protein FtsQ
MKPRHAAMAAIGAMLVGTLSVGWVWMDRSGIGERVADWTSDRASDALRVTARAGFGVREIVVTGRVHTSAAEILDALDLHDGEPLLGFDGVVARAALERLPWVREAQVERRFPSTVRVQIIERTPLALWQTQGRHVVLDTDGKEIRRADPGAFANLVMVVGADAPAHTRELLALLATEPDLKGRVNAAVRVGGRRWDLVLDGETRVQLPEQQIAVAWARLADAQRREAILGRAVARIDLRLADRMTIQPVAATAAPTASGAAGQQTASRPRPVIRSN